MFRERIDQGSIAVSIVAVKFEILKIDIQLRDPLGHSETISTIQVDFHLPHQFQLEYVGEDHVVVGTDYGHHTPGTTDRLAADPSAQVHMVNNLRDRSDLPTELLEKLLVHNPARLYGGA